MNSRPDYDTLYRIAEDQAGYFTARQARMAGFSWERLSYYAKNGKFLRIVRGVYRLAHFPGSPREDLFIAWLRTGPNSIISHYSALSVYDLTDIIPGEVHVIIPRSASHRRKGIRMHTNTLRQDETTMREGLPLTTVARTISDVITSGIAEEQIHQAIVEALEKGLTTQEELFNQAGRQGGRAKRMIHMFLNEISKS